MVVDRDENGEPVPKATGKRIRGVNLISIIIDHEESKTKEESLSSSRSKKMLGQGRGSIVDIDSEPLELLIVFLYTTGNLAGRSSSVHCFRYFLPAILLPVRNLFQKPL